MKKFKEMTVTKKLTILVIVVAIIFGGINAFWIFGKNLPYNGYIEKMDSINEDDLVRESYTKTIGNYIYTVYAPSYLGYDDFLSVEGGRVVASTEETGKGICINLNIYPDCFGGYKFKVLLTDETKNQLSLIYIDRDIKNITDNAENIELNEARQKLLDENREQIKQMLDGACELWGI